MQKPACNARVDFAFVGDHAKRVFVLECDATGKAARGAMRFEVLVPLRIPP
jgi:hypothetical protein